MESRWTVEQLREDLLRLIRANEPREDLHMRIQAFVDEDDGRLGSLAPISVTMAAIPMGRYFQKEGLSVGVSFSWVHVQRCGVRRGLS